MSSNIAQFTTEKSTSEKDIYNILNKSLEAANQKANSTKTVSFTNNDLNSLDSEELGTEIAKESDAKISDKKRFWTDWDNLQKYNFILFTNYIFSGLF